MHIKGKQPYPEVKLFSDLSLTTNSFIITGSAVPGHKYNTYYIASHIVSQGAVCSDCAKIAQLSVIRVDVYFHICIAAAVLQSFDEHIELIQTLHCEICITERIVPCIYVVFKADIAVNAAVI